MQSCFAALCAVPVDESITHPESRILDEDHSDDMQHIGGSGGDFGASSTSAAAARHAITASEAAIVAIAAADAASKATDAAVAASQSIAMSLAHASATADGRRLGDEDKKTIREMMREVGHTAAGVKSDRELGLFDVILAV